jgi:formyl-CoA transferase
MFALYHRDVHHGSGQVIDVSLFESLFSLLGPLPAEYQSLGRLRERNGSRSKNAGPRGCYRTSDGRYVAVSGSTPKMAERFLQAYGLDHLLADERFRTNEARVRHAADLDEQIVAAIASRSLQENLQIIDRNELTAIAVQTVADIEKDPHWQARNLLVDVPNGAGTIRMHNVVPRMSATPGEVRDAGGALGEDNDAIYGDELGLSGEQREGLRRAGVI